MPLAPRREVVVHGELFGGLAGQQTVDEVAADETGAAHHTDPPDRSLAHRNDSHRVAVRARAGCDTSRCHTTAHRPPVCGVMWSAYSGGITTQASASWAVVPPSRPTTPKIGVPRSRASRRAATRLVETPLAALPPPTEKTSSASRPESRDPLSHSAKVVSQPSSFVRAVSSDTLSVGV